MSCRFFIPKSKSCCAVLLIVSLGILLVLLGLYYKQDFLEEIVGQKLRPFDLVSEGSIFTWFLSVLWLVISAVGLVATRMTLSQRSLKSCFWFAVALIGLSMSCITACGLSGILFRLARKTGSLISGGALSESSSLMVFFGILFIGGGLLVLYVFRYVSYFMPTSRAALRFLFFCAFSFMTASVCLHVMIPTEEDIAKYEKRLASRTADSDAAGRSSEKDKAGKKGDSGDYISCAYSSGEEDTAVERPRIRNWGDLFAIDPVGNDGENTAESTGTESTAESTAASGGCFLSGLNLDLIRTREICRKGSYALFVVFLCVAVLSLARVERLCVEYQLKAIKKMRQYWYRQLQKTASNIQGQRVPFNNMKNNRMMKLNDTAFQPR